jgi:hypothetical protein
MKGYFFGPVSSKKQITFVDADIYPTTNLQTGIAFSDLVVGETYKISNLGSNRNWNAIGADSDPAVGETFTVNSQLSSYVNTGTGGTATPTTRASGSQITVQPAVPVDMASIPSNTSVRIYKLGDQTADVNQASWNTFLSTSGQTYKVGDVITIPTPNANRPSGALVTKLVTGLIADDTARDAFTQSIGIDDDWKAMVVISDGDGDGATTSGVAKEHE